MSDDQSAVFRQTDCLDPARAMALLATLSRDGHIRHGDPLPPFFHQIYFWIALSADKLGRDGHPALGQGLVPDMGLPRRMWAGGRLRFHKPLRAGMSADCITRLLRTARKTGRTGPLGLVTLHYGYSQKGSLCVEEERDLIYREDPDPNVPTPKSLMAPDGESHSQTVEFDSTKLFRYSALTFNGHRIHYDEAYAKSVEGYAGLVVHGPLLAQHLMLFAQDTYGSIKTFTFRATAPLMHFESATLCLKDQDLWVRGPDGRLCMQAEVTV